MITFMFSSWCAQKLVEGVCRTQLSQSTQITEGFCVSCGCRHTSIRFVQLFASFAAVSALEWVYRDCDLIGAALVWEVGQGTEWLSSAQYSSSVGECRQMSPASIAITPFPPITPLTLFLFSYKAQTTHLKEMLNPLGPVCSYYIFVG